MFAHILTGAKRQPLANLGAPRTEIYILSQRGTLRDDAESWAAKMQGHGESEARCQMSVKSLAWPYGVMGGGGGVLGCYDRLRVSHHITNTQGLDFEKLSFTFNEQIFTSKNCAAKFNSALSGTVTETLPSGNSEIVMTNLSLRLQIYPQFESRPRRHKNKRSLNLLPAEVVLQIISYLSTSAHLSLRLASRRYYTLSSQAPLITQLWFSPYLEDRKTFKGVCDHQFLGEQVTALTYDITRFRKFSFDELREFWPKPWKADREPYTRDQKGKGWLENHPGLWQYLEVVREAKSSGFDEGKALTE
ncbi:hypothetical protein V498_10636, partial [Pseudogymnoascus sp. VKM F-4517 (FW-2822)]